MGSRYDSEARWAVAAGSAGIAALVGATLGRRSIPLGVAGGLATFAGLLAFWMVAGRALGSAMDRASADDGPADELPPFGVLSIADARRLADQLLQNPAAFAVTPAAGGADLAALPSAIRELFTRFSSIASEDGCSWLSHDSLEWAPWDPSLRVIGGDRDGVRVAMRPGDETVYEVAPDIHDPRRLEVAEYASVYHWLVAQAGAGLSRS